MSVINQIKIVSREEWGADPLDYNIPLESPTKYISLSYVKPREGIKDERETLRELMHSCQAQGHFDIQSNFIIGKTGTVYEGRGWHVRTELSESSTSRQKDHLGRYLEITFIGDYMKGDQKNNPLLKAAGELLMMGRKLGLIDENFKFLEDYVSKGPSAAVFSPDYRNGNEAFSHMQRYLYQPENQPK